jgi:hypothetical protein
MKQLQIDQADQFKLLAEENRVNMRLIPPARGLIFDRNGVPLADQRAVYRIVSRARGGRGAREALARPVRRMPLDPSTDRASAEMDAWPPRARHGARPRDLGRRGPASAANAPPGPHHRRGGPVRAQPNAADTAHSGWAMWAP